MRQNEGTRSSSPRRLIATKLAAAVQVQVKERMRVVELREGARQFPALARVHLTQFRLIDHV